MLDFKAATVIGLFDDGKFIVPADTVDEGMYLAETCLRAVAPINSADTTLYLYQRVGSVTFDSNTGTITRNI